jgi:hypothetical protein
VQQAALQPERVPSTPKTTLEADRPGDRPRSSPHVARADTKAEERVNKGPEVDAPPAEATEELAKEPPRDPRAVPEGTPSAIARVFRRLPVSVRDGPPIGGIGATGIHIDKIWLGDRYRKKRGCIGTADDFSIAAGAHVNVCFRVVHSRVDEDVTVVWEKDGDRVKRRRGVTIPGVHAYRSRSFLVLRREYTARWIVRIFSEDGVELASTSFTVID